MVFGFKHRNFLQDDPWVGIAIVRGLLVFYIIGVMGLYM